MLNYQRVSLLIHPPSTPLRSIHCREPLPKASRHRSGAIQRDKVTRNHWDFMGYTYRLQCQWCTHIMPWWKAPKTYVLSSKNRKHSRAIYFCDLWWLTFRFPVCFIPMTRIQWPASCNLHPKTRAMAKPWKKTVGSACSLGKAIETTNLPNEFMFIQLK